MPSGGLLRAQDSGRLEICVLDPSGAGVPSAKVTIAGADGAVKEGSTDASGMYRSGALPSGEYTVAVSATGFRPYRSGTITVA